LNKISAKKRSFITCPEIVLEKHAYDLRYSFTQTLQIMKLLPLLFGFLLLSFFAQAQDVSEVDQMPYFKGCKHLKDGTAEKRNESNRKIVEFVQENLTYPDSAKVMGIEGVAFVRFRINETGQVENPTLLYDLGYGCGEEALRIIQNMPRWEPAVKAGQPVSVELEMPVRFEFIDEDVLDGYRLVWGDLNEGKVSRRKLRKLMKFPIYVLTELGEKVDILELNVVIVRKDKIVKEKLSGGKLILKQKKMLRRVLPNSLIVLIGTIQQKGKFYYIRRELRLQ